MIAILSNTSTTNNYKELAALFSDLNRIEITRKFLNTENSLIL